MICINELVSIDLNNQNFISKFIIGLIVIVKNIQTKQTQF